MKSSITTYKLKPVIVLVFGLHIVEITSGSQ